MGTTGLCTKNWYSMPFAQYTESSMERTGKKKPFNVEIDKMSQQAAKLPPE